MAPILTVIVFLSIFAMFTAAAGELAIERLHGTNRAYLQQRANYGCQVGFLMATEWLEAQINYNPSLNTMTLGTIDPNPYNATHSQIPLAADPETLVTSRIYSNLNNTVPAVGPDEVMIEPGQLYIQTVATVGAMCVPATSAHMGGFATAGTQDFPDGILANSKIVLSNSTIQTYLSATDKVQGPIAAFYSLQQDAANAPVAMAAGYPNSTLAQAARVCTNGRTPGSVSLLNGSTIYGNVTIGAGGSPGSAVTYTGGSSINPASGSTVVPAGAPLFLAKYKPPVPLDDPSVISTPVVGGSISVTAGTFYKDLTVNSGTLTLVPTQNQGSNDFLFGNLTLNNSRLVLTNPNPGGCNPTFPGAGPPPSGLNPSLAHYKVYIGNNLNVTGSIVNDAYAYYIGSDDVGDVPGGPLGAAAPPFCPVDTSVDGHLAGKYGAMWSYSLNFFGVGSGGPLGNCNMNISSSRVFALLGGAVTNVTITGCGGNMPGIPAIKNHSTGVITPAHLGCSPYGFYGGIKANTVTLTDSNLFYDDAVQIGTPNLTPPSVAAGGDSPATALWGRVSWSMQGVTDYGFNLYNAMSTGPGGGPVGIGTVGGVSYGSGSVGSGAGSGAASMATSSIGATSVSGSTGGVGGAVGPGAGGVAGPGALGAGAGPGGVGGASVIGAASAVAGNGAASTAAVAAAAGTAAAAATASAAAVAASSSGG
jgi:hypothetical protein